MDIHLSGLSLLESIELQIKALKDVAQLKDTIGLTFKDMKMQDFLENKGTRYVVAYHKNQEDLFILKRANQEKCEKYKRKIERRQARKSWFDTYDSIIKIVIPIITFIMGLVIGTIKKC